MANSAQARKRARQADKWRLHNQAQRNQMRTFIKKVAKVIASGNKDDADKALLQAVKALNKAASDGVIHSNNASRNISRLTKKVNSLTPQADLSSAGAA